MNELLKEAKAIESELIQMRRELHQIPEIGIELPKTAAYVKAKLIEYGYEPTEIYTNAIVATVGDTSKKAILLRADMDALPMKEESGLEFAATGDACHSCGHDLHMATLLGAAKLLKQHESELNGCVKFMFQPDEEGYSGDDVGGAEHMLLNGVLENPTVGACFSTHIWSGLYSTGKISWRKGGFMSSCDNITIEIQGKAAHGSRPEDGISPINIGCHIYLGLQELISREVPPYEQTVLTCGAFNSGSTCNQIPNTATLNGTLRTENESVRTFLKKRITEIVEGTAKIYGGTATVKFWAGIPSVYNNPALTDELIGYSKELLGAENFIEEPHTHSSSDDISVISQACPTTYVFLCCGSPEEGYTQSHHHPAILFNEDVLHLGAALFAHNAIEWLKHNN